MKPISFEVTAPTRVDLCGGTLDLWPLYTFFDDAITINAAIDLRARAKFKVENHTVCKVTVQNAQGETHTFYEPLNAEALTKVPASIRFPVAIVSRYLKQHKTLPEISLQIEVSSEAPLRSGLGGSSTLCVAVARGMSRLFNEYVDQAWRINLLHWVKDLEAGFLRTPTGTQDYLAALYGGLNAFHFSTGKITQEGYSDETFQELNKRTLVLFSGEMHHSGVSNWEIYKSAIEGRGEILSGLKEIKQLSSQLDEELRLHSCNWQTVGKILSDEWEIRKRIFKVDTPRLTEILSHLGKLNILGAKVCGAASGGSLLVLVEPAEQDAVIRDCQANKIQVLETSLSETGVGFTDLPSAAK